jgi:beta-galactosidase
MRHGCLLLAAFAWLGYVSAVVAAPRTVIDLRSGWLFKQGPESGDVQSAAFDDSRWSHVTLPHTWNRIGNEGLTRSPESNNYQGVSWYRLRFPTPAAARGQSAFLQFDGVGAIADVWVNGKNIGKHEGAFSRFRFDVTDALNAQGENVLVVKADNSKPAPGSTTAHVIPLSGDFFIFGGLYRNVSLILTAPVHIDLADFGGPGVYGRTLRLVDDEATISVSSRVVNDTSAKQTVSVSTVIEDGSGRAVAKDEQRPELSPGKTVVSESELELQAPRLWKGTSDPYLYRIVVTVRSAKGELLDQITQPLGIRTMTFDPQKGFYLNGQHMMLVGASMHQDRPVKGWALSRADRVQDFDLLQEMGGNAVRFAHYQHDEMVYELADARGIVAWAEIPLVNEVSFDGSPASEALSANAHQQLTELIKQNFNHPSIAVWSVGNEIDLRSTSGNRPARAGSLVKSLNALAKQLDPNRQTTLADCCEQAAKGEQKPRDVLVGLTDVVGYNRYFGWYSGKLENLGPALDEAHARHPQLPISVSEYGAGAALTQHTDNALGGPINSHGRPHPEEYQLLFHEESWRQLREREYLWGAFIWNMFDFASDSRSEGDLTDINEKGMVSYDRSVKKDVFYFYKANWNPAPTLHLVGRRYIDRAYGVVDVKAYSNAAQVHLLLNGHDAGTATCEGGICVWRAVHLLPGINQIVAKTPEGLTDSVEWRFNGSPSMVRINAGDLSGHIATDGARYGSDNFFVGGEGRALAGDAIPPLYTSYRAGAFSYDVPVPDGEYAVTARFIEPTETSAGKRVFDVVSNRKVVLSGVDPFKLSGGKLKPVERSFTARATNGHLQIEFRPRADMTAVVSALEVISKEDKRRNSP